MTGERCLGPNITLDWDGHSLIGSGSTVVDINASAAGGNVIRNGEITGRGTGVNMGPYSEVSEWIISDVVFRDAPVHNFGVDLKMTRATAVNSPTLGNSVEIKQSWLPVSPDLVSMCSVRPPRSSVQP